jgi:glycosyltransferase 2 family protein
LKVSVKDVLKLIISIIITGYVLREISKDFDWSKVWPALVDFKYGWIFLSIALSILSHFIRAYRWTLLLDTGGYQPKIFTTYLAVMVCYLVNMAIPRLGELARCTVLKNEYEIPVSFSLGTVITDRLTDLLMLAVLTFFLLTSQIDVVGDYFTNFVSDKLPFLVTNWPYLLGVGVMGSVALFVIIRKSKNDLSKSSLAYKIGKFTSDIGTGIITITKIKKQLQFWLSTIAIWALYFLMLYVISFGFAPTADMSLMAGLAVLVMGSLGMAAPVNNGIGVYQALVASILVYYGIEHNDGFVFALISHGSQLAAVVVFGFISLLILNFRKRKNIIEAK